MQVFRVISFAISILIQLAVLISIIIWFNRYFVVFYGISILISIAAVIWILNNQMNPAYKIAWIIPIMLFPILGGLFYLFFGGNRMGKKTKVKMESILGKTTENLKDDGHVLEMIRQQSVEAANQSRYIGKYSNYPPYCNEYAEYLSSGEEKFKKLLDFTVKFPIKIPIEVLNSEVNTRKRFAVELSKKLGRPITIENYSKTFVAGFNFL